MQFTDLPHININPDEIKKIITWLIDWLKDDRKGWVIIFSL